MKQVTLQFLKENLHHYDDPALKRICRLHKDKVSIKKLGRKNNEFTHKSIALTLDIGVSRVGQILEKSAVKSPHNFAVLLHALNGDNIDPSDLEDVIRELRQSDKFIIRTQEIVICKLINELDELKEKGLIK